MYEMQQDFLLIQTVTDLLSEMIEKYLPSCLLFVCRLFFILPTELAQRRRYEGRNLTDLPIELLGEILENLSWKDILHARQTCKYLSKASRLWGVWEHQYKASSITTPRLLEVPANFYTSQELENIFLRWKRSQLAWKIDRNAYALSRNIVADKAHKVHLVEGGRWLLTTSQTGRTNYYDLNAETITGQLLIPDQIEDHPFFSKYDISTIGISVDIDGTSPILKFNMAFSLLRPLDDSPLMTDMEKLIRIWSVSIVLNDSQKAVGLSAKLLASFPQHPSVQFRYSISLLGPYIAFSVRNEDLCLCSLIVEWEHANKSPSNYPCRVIYSHESRDLHLLPNNKMLAISGNILRFYDHLSVKEIASVEPLDPMDPSRRGKLLWELEVQQLFDRTISGPFLVSGTARFVLLTDQAVYGLIIDTAGSSVNDECAPQLVKLMDSPHRYRFTGSNLHLLGYYQGVAVASDSSVRLLRYSFPDEQEGGLETEELTGGSVNVPTTVGHAWALCPVMDEGSGRMVLTNPRDGHRILFEFSHVT